MASIVSQGQVTALELQQIGPLRATSGPLVIEGPIESWRDFRAETAHVLPLVVWATQPSVRKVVDYIARALAATPLKVYRRVSDTDRQRVTDHPLARVLANPSAGVIPFRFWHSILVDWLIFDRWVALKASNNDPARVLDLIRVQAERTQFTDDGLARVEGIWVDGRTKLAPESCLFDHGYSPLHANGTTPMSTLSATLAESREAVEYRRAMWKRGARVPVVLQRPVNAPKWSDDARKRFSESWRKFSSGGGQEGGTPVLQDGMTLEKVDAFTPKDTNDIAGRQLTDAEVASHFHIAPELVGARAGTYSNMDAFRQMLYRDSLGPYYVPWEQVVNTMLVASLDPTGELYVEADLDSKLRGSFDEQASVMSTSVGAPWLTRNEARARQNLSAVPGGDQLITPLNVLEGGQASPTDSGTQNQSAGRPAAAKAAVARVKAGEPAGQAGAEAVMTAFFARQRDAVLPAIGAKAAGDWWDQARWDGELADDLHALAATVTAEIGKSAAESLGFNADDYDAARTTAFLRVVAERNASSINATTKTQLDAALASSGDVTPDAVFALAVSQRAGAAASSIDTANTSFGRTEAGRQLGGGKATKTWIAGENPRASHAAMDGETVGVDVPFSNGLNWPGDGGDADEVAGCNCGVRVTIP